VISVRCRRFDPGLSQLRQRVCAGEIGKLHVVKTCSRDHPLPRAEYIAISGLFSASVRASFL